VNLAMLFLSQVSCGRHHQVSAAGLPLFLLIINICFFLLFIIQPPPRFIQVDKEAGTITYALLFRRQKVVLEYSRVWSEFTTRGSRTGPKKVWSLSLDDKELFFVPIGYTGWTEKQLFDLNNLIVDSLSTKKAR
jgi:hypothetical protein